MRPIWLLIGVKNVYYSNIRVPGLTLKRLIGSTETFMTLKKLKGLGPSSV